MATRADDAARRRTDNSGPDWQHLALRRCLVASDYGVGQATESSGRVAVLGMGNVADGTIVGEPAGYLPAAPARLLLSPGDLLFNRTNSLGLVGKVGLVEEVNGPTTFASYLVRLRTSHLASASYLNYLLNTREVLGLARSMALPSVGQANLNPSRYGGMIIPMPSRALQDGIVAELQEEQTRTRELSTKLEAQIALLREHREALITAATTGEAAIPAAAAPHDR